MSSAPTSRRVLVVSAGGRRRCRCTPLLPNDDDFMHFLPGNPLSTQVLRVALPQLGTPLTLTGVCMQRLLCIRPADCPYAVLDQSGDASQPTK
jgi:hypothetical protein